MLTCEFSHNYAAVKPIIMSSPEIRYLQHLSQGGSQVDLYFDAMTLYQKPVMLDTPYGVYSGLEEIKTFSKQWLVRANAISAQIRPVIQTISAGRAVTEMEVRFLGKDKKIRVVPMAVFGDLAPDGRLSGMRMYWFYQWMPDTSAYRKPIFRPALMKPCESFILTGVVRHYYEQMHNSNSSEALQNILDMSSDRLAYGGYRPKEVEPVGVGKKWLSEVYKVITASIPRDQYIRLETITDDGINCLVEWTSVMRSGGIRAGFVSQAGMAGYTRGEKGELVSVRFCDNLGFETEIDRSLVLPEDQFVEED